MFEDGDKVRIKESSDVPYQGISGVVHQVFHSDPPEHTIYLVKLDYYGHHVVLCKAHDIELRGV